MSSSLGREPWFQAAWYSTSPCRTSTAWIFRSGSLFGLVRSGERHGLESEQLRLEKLLRQSCEVDPDERAAPAGRDAGVRNLFAAEPHRVPLRLTLVRQRNTETSARQRNGNQQGFPESAPAGLDSPVWRSCYRTQRPLFNAATTRVTAERRNAVEFSGERATTQWEQHEWHATFTLKR
jgi:hypothetical protein